MRASGVGTNADAHQEKALSFNKDVRNAQRQYRSDKNKRCEKWTEKYRRRKV
jgi:hypothetical protein